jgi:hypothetical protein
VDLRRTLLHGGSASERELLERLLRHDFCLPRDEGAKELASEVRARVGVHVPRPGETPLVAVNGNQASLWLLEPRPGRVEFIGSAKASLKLAEQRVTRDLPLLFEATASPEAWSAERLVTGTERSLDGSSFGLSFCLAFASLMLLVPLPSDLLASAAVTPDGDLEAVDEAGLGRKLALLRDSAPGVRSVLVASENAAYAEGCARDLGAAFRIVPAVSLHAALEVAFPNLIRALEARFEDTRQQQHAAHRLFELVRDGSSALLSWRGVAASCRFLRGRLPEGSDALREAEFAEAVARRHAGEELPCPLHFEWVEGMRREPRLRVIAHLVEHSRFHEPGERQAIREFAERELSGRPLDDGTEDLAALGALGRNYALYREFGAAEASLERALHGYRELGHIDQSSFALSEWIRILGLQRRLDALRSLTAPADAGALEAVEPSLLGYVTEFAAAPGVSPLSRAFVHFALGRAFVQAGSPVEAQPFLAGSADVNWSLTPAHLQASRLRWSGRALALVGAAEAAERAFAELRALAKVSPEAEFAALLADIDAALERGADATAALDALRRLEPRAIGHIEAQTNVSDAADAARAVAMHYPY